MAMMMVLAGGVAAAGSLTVTGAKCEQRACPLGIDVAKPGFGWTLGSARRGDTQTAYQVLAASEPVLLETGKSDLWDSGKVDSGQSLGIPYAGKPLKPGQKVWWKVRVWDRDGEAGPYGERQWFEMALLAPDDWHGKWISDGKPLPQRDEDFFAPSPAPLLRKGFKATGPIKRARLCISGLGYHEVLFNGERAGDARLDPGWTSYDTRVPYSSWDVTSLLHEGDNVIGVMLGNGWYNPLPLRLWGHLNLREHLATGRPRVIAQLNIEYADGSTAGVVTDETWRTADGPILRNNIYLGEIYDARKELAGWSAAGFDDSAWRAATVEKGTVGPLCAQSPPPIRVTESIPAQRVSEPKPGVFLYDFGQNFTGLVNLRKIQAPAGTKVVMRYGELLNPDGTLNPMTSVCGQIKNQPKGATDGGQNVAVSGPPEVAWQGDTYIAKGGGEEDYTPRFTFHGFRYVEITGLPAAPNVENVLGLRLHSDVGHANGDLPDSSSFACSNERFNRIQEMCRRTFVSNLIGVQSDCPHRERFGYGGDIVATSEALLLNFEMATFYQKTVRDWADSVRPDGMLTDTAPFVGIDYCGIGWAMAHPLLVSQLYQYHGDRRLMEEQYEVARRWLSLVAERYPQAVVPDGLGDHESLAKVTKPPLVTALYFQCATMLGEMAGVLGKTEDVTRFTALAAKIRNAWQREFLDQKTGVAGTGTQACQAFALYTGVVPEAARPLAVDRLVEDIRGKYKGHLSTGIFGTKFMLDVLSREGHADVAFDIVNQPDMPGWGWMLENGATTLWEHWAGSDNTYSQNHPMFGSVSQWFYNWLGGIRPAPDAVGFDKILIAPQPVGDLKWVKACCQSVRGPVKCEWKKEGGMFDLQVAVPVGATATVFVPAKDAASVTEGGKPASQAEGVKFLRMERGAAVFAVGGGGYDFVSR